jgi:transposase-like protein
MDELAERMAGGCATVSAAAREMGISQSLGDRLWQAIRRDLGPQAR